MASTAKKSKIGSHTQPADMSSPKSTVSKNTPGRKTYPRRKRLVKKPFNFTEEQQMDYFVFYGIEDKRAFPVRVGSKTMFGGEFANTTLEERRDWELESTITIMWNDEPTACKLARKCFTMEEAKKYVAILADKFARASDCANGRSNADDPDDFDSDGEDEDDRQGSENEENDSEESDDETDVPDAADELKRSYEQRRQHELSRFNPNSPRLNPQPIEPAGQPPEQEDMMEMLRSIKNALVGCQTDISSVKTSQKASEVARTKDSRNMWKAIRGVEAKVGLNQADEPLDQQDGIFTAADELKWMGVQAYKFFNRILAKYGGDVRVCGTKLGLEMWGDRIMYHYIIPLGREKTRDQRRRLLREKDPSGVLCYKAALKKMFIEQERARLAGKYDGDQLKDKLDDFITSKIDFSMKPVRRAMSQQGLDLTNDRKSFIRKAHYYSLLEDGHKPTVDWTIEKEAYADAVYRECCVNADEREQSVIIAIGQEIYDATGDGDKITMIKEQYRVSHPNLAI